MKKEVLIGSIDAHFDEERIQKRRPVLYIFGECRLSRYDEPEGKQRYGYASKPHGQLRLLGDESVSNGVEGLDKLRVGSVVSQLFPQVQNVGIDRSGGDSRAVVPDRGQQ